GGGHLRIAPRRARGRRRVARGPRPRRHRAVSSIPAWGETIAQGSASRERRVLGQFASPEQLSSRPTAGPFGSKSHVLGRLQTLNVHTGTPRVAGSLGRGGSS